MRALEFLGLGGETRLFRVPQPSQRSEFQEEIKGMVRPVEPDIDPRITDAITASRPTDVEREGLIDTYADWISDSIINPAEGNDEVVNVMRAIVSEDTPLPIDQVAAMTGTEADRVESIAKVFPFVEFDDVNGQKQVDMPEVQGLFGKWKEIAEQQLPEGTDPEILDQLLTPPPTIGVEVFNSQR